MMTEISKAKYALSKTKGKPPTIVIVHQISLFSLLIVC